MKLKKEIILTALITAIITGTVAVAAVSLSAKDIGFKPNNQEWNATNVEDAMNDLYILGNEKSRIIKLGTYNNTYNGVENGISGEDITIDLSSYDGFEKFTTNNFIIEAIEGVFGVKFQNDTHQQTMNFFFTKTYDQSTGKLIITNTYVNNLGQARLSAGLTEYNIWLVYWFIIIIRNYPYFFVTNLSKKVVICKK